jgi:hypothetical protein
LVHFRQKRATSRVLGRPYLLLTPPPLAPANRHFPVYVSRDAASAGRVAGVGKAATSVFIDGDMADGDEVVVA